MSFKFGAHIPFVNLLGFTLEGFADGHSEIKKWQSATSKYNAVRYSYPPTMNFDATGKNDFAWYLERTGLVRISDGHM